MPPRRSTPSNDPKGLANSIADDLNTYADRLGAQSARENAALLVEVGDRLRDLGASIVPGRAGKARMLSLLVDNVGVPLPSRELETVAGIGEWARRIRELRVEEGWPIFSADTLKDIQSVDAGQAGEIERQIGVAIRDMDSESYVLLSVERDTHAAQAWQLLNELSGQKISVKEKILTFLQANIGYIISGEQLRYLARGKTEWARRTRELRTEDGWPVLTRMQGRPDIPVGFYLLEENKQAPAHDRKISDAVRIEVLERDGFSCRQCGWTRENLSPDDPRKFLELHHVQEHADGGENTVVNLVTLCNVHHDEVHAGKLSLPINWP